MKLPWLYQLCTTRTLRAETNTKLKLWPQRYMEVAFSHRSFNQKQLSRVVLRKKCSENMHQFAGEQACRSVISIKFQSNFIEIALRHGCSPVNLLHIFRTTFLNNTSGRLLLKCVFRSSVVEFNNTETCKPVILKWFQSKVQPYLGLRHESNIWNFDLREYTFVSIFCKRGKNLSCYGKILYCTLFSIEFTSLTGTMPL